MHPFLSIVPPGVEEKNCVMQSFFTRSAPRWSISISNFGHFSSSDLVSNTIFMLYEIDLYEIDFEFVKIASSENRRGLMP